MEKTKRASLWEKNIIRMLQDKDYEFAEDYLNSVLKYIKDNGDITPKQLQGVLNIRRSVL